MNFVEIIGNVANEPENRVTANGVKMTSFSVADNYRKGDRDEVTWWKVVVWDGELSRIVPYLKKGSRVVVYGTMRKPRTYTDSSGNVQVALELRACMIRFLPSAKSDQSGDGVSTRGYSDVGFDNISYSVEHSSGGFSPGEAQSSAVTEEHFADGISPF